jgi:hypothetical protein
VYWPTICSASFWQDDKLGFRAQHAYPLDKAFGQFRPDADITIKALPRNMTPKHAKPMNQLQLTHFKMAKALEDDLPPGRKTGINRQKITTDQQAQHYVSRVYALAAGFATPKGRKCGCS